MPSVPSTKETGVVAPVCPHAAKLHAHANGDGMLPEGPFPMKGVDELPEVEEEAEDVDGPIQLNTGGPAGERKWIRPDLVSRCTWRLGGSNENSPHLHPAK